MNLKHCLPFREEKCVVERSLRCLLRSFENRGGTGLEFSSSGKKKTIVVLITSWLMHYLTIQHTSPGLDMSKIIYDKISFLAPHFKSNFNKCATPIHIT